MNNKKRVPSFDDFVNEGLVSMGRREKTDADKFQQHRDAVPKTVPAIIDALTPDQTFENKEGTIFRVMSNDKTKIKFVQLLFNGKDSNETSNMPAKILAQLFKNGEYFFTSKKKYSSFK